MLLISVADIGEGEVVPLPNVSASILAKVIEYCTEHVKYNEANDALVAWDAEFCKVDKGTLFELIQVANYLNVQPLMELTCNTVVDMIRGKTPEEISAAFNIGHAFSSEEEVRRYVFCLVVVLVTLFVILPLSDFCCSENSWAFSEMITVT